MVTCSSILAWKIPWAEEAGKLQSMWHKETDKTEWLSTHTEDIWGHRVSSQKFHCEKGLSELVESLEASVQFSCSVVSDSLWPHGLQHASLPYPSPTPRACSNSCPSSSIFILCHSLPFLPSIFSTIRVFSHESVLRIRWPEYWSYSLSISPSNEYSELISFRIDQFDLLAVQGTLKCLLQQHSSKASIIQHSALFRAQLSHPYISSIE